LGSRVGTVVTVNPLGGGVTAVAVIADQSKDE
jgi:hypothetical protein